MKTFTIDAENNITVFASKKEAAASTTQLSINIVASAGSGGEAQSKHKEGFDPLSARPA